MSAPYQNAANRAAKRYGIPTKMFSRLINQESGWNPTIHSPAGAVGLTQLMPATAASLRVNPLDPIANLDGGARYLRQQYDRFGTWELALAAYNAGPGNVESGAWKTFSETTRYVKNVLGDWKTGVSTSSPPVSSTPASIPSQPSTVVTLPPPSGQWRLSPSFNDPLAAGAFPNDPFGAATFSGLGKIAQGWKPTSTLAGILQSVERAPPAPLGGKPAKPAPAAPVPVPAPPTATLAPVPPGTTKGGKVGDMSWIFAQPGVNLGPVDPHLLSAVNALGQFLGKKITVNSGYRTRAQQAGLYQAYVNSGFNIAHIAAKPGTSNHERGQALDLAIDGVPITLAVPAATLARFGLHTPVKGDLPHTTLLSVSG